MNPDPIVEEVRRIRAELLAEAGGDLNRLVEMLRKSEASEDRPIVSRPPKRPEIASGDAA